MKMIFENGNIITMNEKQPSVEAIYVEDGKIMDMGETMKLVDRYPDAIIKDLKERTMLPGFIDAHSHFTGVANSLRQCDLSQVTSYDEMVQVMKNFMQEHHIPKGEWIIGANYDHNFMKEKAHPNRHVLDLISEDHPIVISHASSHMGVVNTLGLKAANISENEKDLPSGKYGREKDGRVNGYMEESVFVEFQKHMPMPSFHEMVKLYKEAQHIYASYGITTVQEGFATLPLFQLLKGASEVNTFYLDVIAYIDVNEKEDVYSLYPEYQNYHHNLRIGGYKTFLDGSPQGKTAWMQEPYAGSDDCGYPAMSEEALHQAIKKSLQNKHQLLIHCNGDAAASAYVNAYEQEIVNYPHADIRPVMIHAQLVKDEELKRMKALHMMPSFFVAHTWYWGDIHFENFGQERASHISPAKSAEDLHLPYTFHNDSPVIAPDVLKSVWCAVNRYTKTMKPIGFDQAISPKEAIAAVTKNAAYQYFEEANKGELAIGKHADFVILDQDPLTIDRLKIDKINVFETWKDGTCIYHNN